MAPPLLAAVESQRRPDGTDQPTQETPESALWASLKARGLAASIARKIESGAGWPAEWNALTLKAMLKHPAVFSKALHALQSHAALTAFDLIALEALLRDALGGTTLELDASTSSSSAGADVDARIHPPPRRKEEDHERREPQGDGTDARSVIGASDTKRPLVSCSLDDEEARPPKKRRGRPPKKGLAKEQHQPQKPSEPTPQSRKPSTRIKARRSDQDRDRPDQRRPPRKTLFASASKEEEEEDDDEEVEPAETTKASIHDDDDDVSLTTAGRVLVIDGAVGVVESFRGLQRDAVVYWLADARASRHPPRAVNAVVAETATKASSLAKIAFGRAVAIDAKRADLERRAPFRIAHRPGDVVVARHRASYYFAKILSDIGEEGLEFRVHYVRWSARWDEDVHVSSLLSPTVAVGFFDPDKLLRVVDDDDDDNSVPQLEEEEEEDAGDDIFDTETSVDEDEDEDEVILPPAAAKSGRRATASSSSYSSSFSSSALSKTKKKPRAKKKSPNNISASKKPGGATRK